MNNQYIEIPHGCRFIDEANTYRATERRSHIVYICMPYFGTNIRNYLTGEKFIVNEENPVVVSGVAGEMYATPLKNILREYSLPDGASVYDYLKQRFKSKTLFFDWMKVKYTPAAFSPRFYALFIPETERFRLTTANGIFDVNHPDFEHGGGDFIVCNELGVAEPNLQNRWVVNGIIFRRIFSMRGKLGLLNAGKPIPVTPKPQKSFFDSSIILKDFKLTSEPKSDTQEYPKMAVPVGAKTQEQPQNSEYTLFHKIALSVAMALSAYGVKHSTRPQQDLNNTSRFAFIFTDNVSRSATVMMDMSVWNYVINFNSAENGKFFVKGVIHEKNASAAVLAISSVIKNVWR
jgi:hypothetical protein